MGTTNRLQLFGSTTSRCEFLQSSSSTQNVLHHMSVNACAVRYVCSMREAVHTAVPRVAARCTPACDYFLQRTFAAQKHTKGVHKQRVGPFVAIAAYHMLARLLDSTDYSVEVLPGLRTCPRKGVSVLGMPREHQKRCDVFLLCARALVAAAVLLQLVPQLQTPGCSAHMCSFTAGGRSVHARAREERLSTAGNHAAGLLWCRQHSVRAVNMR